ncbi:MAG: ATP-binding protein [Alphaproteobacteria bacterium]|nr:ATP-binding protein [Alphaproteobacteria bacterium]MDP6815328.1 ATP-binding protein [Alphaproteobacteria bacterium]
MKDSATTVPAGRRPISLQARLAWRLGGVLVVSMSLVVFTLLYYVWAAFDDLDDASLQVQAQQIAGHLSADGGHLTLRLPATLAAAYRDSGNGFLYAIKDPAGEVVIASSEQARQLIAPVSPPLELPFFFRLANLRGGESPYYSLALSLTEFSGHVLFVAQGQIHRDVYIDTLLAESSEHIAWILPLILLAALFIAIWTIRSSLAPLAAVSVRASRIDPHNTDIRLPLGGIPNEIRPLVEAINGALSRLERGFRLQRQFTANAAHELRTPLAILTARLDELDRSETAAELAVDIERMNRLVEQLLRVSRLDAEDLQLDEDIDLNGLGAEVVGYLAPLAIAAGQSLSLSPAGVAVTVRGNRAALGDALRNLIENATQHGPAGGEVVVDIAPPGSITVRDQGPGVDDGDKPQVFRRFWRGPRRTGVGSGLGLAIVAETAAAHGGDVAVHDNAAGGAAFVLRLPPRP